MIKIQELMKKNLRFLFSGYFFMAVSMVLLNYFLPFYLKEKGLSILRIGTLLTVGIAIGSLVISLLFSRLQQKIKLKSGLKFGPTLYFLASFIFYIIPSSIGVIFSNIFLGSGKALSRIATDITMQHNSSKNNHQKVSSIHLIIDSLAMVIGVILSLILMNLFGFAHSLLIFSLIALISLFFYNKVKEETRFKAKKSYKLPKIDFDLKLILLSEILYWLGLAASFSLVITFLVVDSFSGSKEWIGVLLIALYLSMTLTTFIVRKFIEKRNLFKTSILGMVILLLSAILIIISRNLYLVFFAMVLEGIGAGIWVPSKTALYWGKTHPGLREKVSGYLGGLRSFANTIGPLVGALLVSYFGILSPFYLKAMIAILSILIYAYLFIKSRKQ